MKFDFLSRKADYLGITGSVLCIVHCLVTPVLLMTTALLQDTAVRIGFLSLDYVFIGVNAAAVYFATRSHNVPAGIKRGLWGSLTLFAAAILLESYNPLFRYVAYAASAGLILTHLANIRQHRLSHG